MISDKFRLETQEGQTWTDLDGFSMDDKEQNQK